MVVEEKLGTKGVVYWGMRTVAMCRCAIQIPNTVFIQTVLISAFVSRSDIGFKLGMVTKW